MGKKKGKKEKKEGGSTAVRMDEQEVRTMEYYQVKLADMTEKMERMYVCSRWLIGRKLKLDTVTSENQTLARAQSKFYNDKQDIVEFLNIKVGEHEKMISGLEAKNKVLEEEKKLVEEKCKFEVDNIQSVTQLEIDNLSFQCQKLKSDLVELSSFSAQRDEMSQQLKQTKAFLEKKEVEYRETVHSLERKVLQDKTTKRAIRENMSITSQLKKMSQKTTEFIMENDDLKAQIQTLKRQNTLLAESEKELAKKSNANQKVIKMLVDKLKESDQMLELAFEENAFATKPEDEAAADPFAPPPQVLTNEMIEEIQNLQDDYNELVERMTSVHVIGQDLKFLLDETSAAMANNSEAEVLDYVHANMTTIVDRLGQLTNFGQILGETEVGSAQSGDSAMNKAFREADFEELDGDEKDSVQYLYNEDPDVEQDMGSMDQSGEDLRIFEPTEDQRLDTQPSTAEATVGQASSHGSHGSKSLSALQRLTITPNAHKKPQNPYQKKIQKNFLSVIAPKTNKKKYVVMSADAHVRDAEVQTAPIAFGPSVDVKYLLGEVRPWGARAEHLPPKGLGLYYSRNPNHLAKATTVDKKFTLPPVQPIMVTNSKSIPS
ncbi:hypothetical protein HDV03_001180 [Kappamyces sp. JEL0829]|nr:hypothetical protein HDV03_001180 [Kappamyces sp. JEL0829]